VQQAMSIKNTTQQAKKIQQLQNQLAKVQQKARAGLKFTTKYKEFELLPTDKFEVRWEKPKTDFDDLGNVKEYTKQELQILKGSDPNKVGYAGALEDLTADQYIRLYFVASKQPPPAKSESDTPSDPFAGRPRVSMVLILVPTTNTPQDAHLSLDKKQ
jgi:hypothetical protein